MLSGGDQVLIEELTLEMSIGIYEFEKAAPQRVIIDICINVKPAEQDMPQNINDVVSYENIVNEVKILSQTKHYDLVETFAEETAQICLKQETSSAVYVKIVKPDVIKEAKSVGVSIFRKKST